MSVDVTWTDYNGTERTNSFESEMAANIFIKGLKAEQRGHRFGHVVSES